MYKFFIAIFFITLTACDDGNFEIPSFEFNESIRSCGEYVLYRTNDDQTEALIIQLGTDDIASVVTTNPLEVPITSDNVQYRIFSDIIGTDYFCSDIPPVSPYVKRTWSGVESPENYISITTTEALNSNNELIGYEHQITLHNLVLESNDERQVYETYYFGSFITNL